MLSNVDGKEYLNVIHKGDAMYIRCWPFVMKDMVSSLDGIGMMRCMRGKSIVLCPRLPIIAGDGREH